MVYVICKPNQSNVPVPFMISTVFSIYKKNRKISIYQLIGLILEDLYEKMNICGKVQHYKNKQREELKHIFKYKLRTWQIF